MQSSCRWLAAYVPQDMPLHISEAEAIREMSDKGNKTGMCANDIAIVFEGADASESGGYDDWASWRTRHYRTAAC